MVEHSSLGSSGVTQTTLSDRLAQWESRVENRLADRFREFEKMQQTRLQELENRMQQTVDRLLDAATAKFQSTVQKQLDQAAENMDKFQNLILDQFKALRSPSSTPVSQPVHYHTGLPAHLHAGHQVLHYGHTNVPSPRSPPLSQELMVGADQNGPGSQ